jgi:hypothetical protein
MAANDPAHSHLEQIVRNFQRSSCEVMKALHA